MVKALWKTPKVVVEPTHREINEEDKFRSISTTRGNATGEVYPMEIVSEILDSDCISFGNSYDDNQDHQGIYFMFWSKDEAKASVNKIRLLRGKDLSLVAA